MVNPISSNISTREPSSLDVPKKTPFFSSLSTLASSTLSSDEMLREIGRKTLEYAEPPADETNWHEKTDRASSTFVKKMSMYAIVSSMNGKISESDAIEIVTSACQTNRSIYDLFMNKCGKNLSWFEWISASWTYFLYYYCGIIPKILDTLAQSLLQTIRCDLVNKEGGANLAKFNDKLLSRLSTFAEHYYFAIEDYAKGGQNLHGAKSEHISMVLSQKQLSPSLICQTFGRTVVREFLPHLSFFDGFCHSSWRIVRFAGRCLDATLGCALSLIVRKSVETQIPSIMQAFIEKSASAPQHLSFMVALTRGIYEQLRQLRVQLEQTKDNPPETTVVAGIQKLPEVVKKLLQILNLEPFDTRWEILEHLHSKPDNSEINTSIKQGAIDAVRLLFSFISDPKNSELILCRLLELCNAPFESGPPSTQAEYEAVKNDMFYEAQALFKTIIHRSVQEKVSGMSPIKLGRLVCLFEEKTRTRTQALVNQLQHQSSNTPIQSFDQMNEAIKNYWVQAKKDDKDLLPSEFQKGLDATTAPFHDHLNHLCDEIRAAKTIQIHQNQQQALYQELANIDSLLREHLFRCTDYSLAIDRVKKMRDAIALSLDLDKTLAHLESTEHTLLKEIQISNALKSLGQKNGMIAQLYRAVCSRTNHEKVSFRFKDVQNIALLKLLPIDEQIELQKAIDDLSVCQDQQSANMCFEKLKFIMQHRYHSHRMLQKNLRVSITQELAVEIHKLSISIESQKSLLALASQRILREIQELKSASSAIRIHKVEPFYKKIGRALASSYASLFAIGGAATLEATASTSFSNAHHIAILGTAGLIGLGFTGKKLYDLCVSHFAAQARETAYHQVIDVFSNLYSFISKSEVWKWVVMDTLHCINEEYSA